MARQNKSRGGVAPKSPRAKTQGGGVALNVPSRTILHGDNLKMMKGINSECADLIYLDPPFNKRRDFVAPLGTEAEGAMFRDIFLATEMKDEILDNLTRISVAHDRLRDWLQSVKAIDQDAQKQNYNYLVWMAVRLLECRRILKPTGSVFLHCDHTMAHYLKLLLGIIFDEKNFRNEIIWRRNFAKGNASRSFGKNHDTILWYSKSSSCKFKQQYREHDEKYLKNYRLIEEGTGRRYRLAALNAPKSNPQSKSYYEFLGVKRTWRWTRERMQEAYEKGLVVQTKPGTVPQQKLYLDEQKGPAIDSIWTDINRLDSHSAERLGYPTQKPLALLRRVIEATTDKGDVVIDPFCGCATSCEAADDSGRQWVGIDVSRKAHDLIMQRLPDLTREISCSEKVPIRTDDGSFTGDTGYVYVISLKYKPDQYKVGIARDVDRRLASYHTSVPDRDAHQLEYRKSTPHYREIEKHVHGSFDSDHEWVRAPLASIIGAIENYPRR